MQMRKMYQTTNKRLRAAQHRKDAQECENAGMRDLAQVNWEMAAWLDPWRPDEDEERTVLSDYSSVTRARARQAA